MSTAAPATVRTPALVLRRVDYGEADRIVTLLTESHGKIAVLARGARRSKQRFGASLEPFGVLEAGLSLGRGSLATLKEASPLRAFPALLASLPAMTAAGRAIEKTRELSPERTPDARLFHTHVEFFDTLDAGAEPDELVMAFELRVLSLLGMPPRLDGCARCGKRRGTRPGTFAASMGGLLCQACGGGSLLLSHETLKAMQHALSSEWAATRFGPSQSGVGEALESFVEWHLRSSRVQD